MLNKQTDLICMECYARGKFMSVHTISGWTTAVSSPLKHDEHPVPMVFFFFFSLWKSI